jgi:hypothetical protein
MLALKYLRCHVSCSAMSDSGLWCGASDHFGRAYLSTSYWVRTLPYIPSPPPPPNSLPLMAMALSPESLNALICFDINDLFSASFCITGYFNTTVPVRIGRKIAERMHNSCRLELLLGLKPTVLHRYHSLDLIVQRLIQRLLLAVAQPPILTARLCGASTSSMINSERTWPSNMRPSPSSPDCPIPRMKEYRFRSVGKQRVLNWR